MVWPRPSEDAVEYIGRSYDIEVIEYPRESRRGLLVCAGTGLMLSIMDHVPALRWCLDVDSLNAMQLERLTPWLQCANNVTELIVVAGWYCSTNPVPLARAVRSIHWQRLCCYVQCHGPGDDPFDDMRTAHSIEDLIAQANERAKPGNVAQALPARRECSASPSRA